MTIIAPTITTNDPSLYSRRLDDFLRFASRIQIDITDGQFAPSQTLNLNQLYWPAASDRNCAIDLHLMISNPLNWLDQIVSLVPDKVILHAECVDAAENLPKMFNHFRKFGISPGLALLPQTNAMDVAALISLVDSVLIFGGNLGYQGGVADLSQLDKVPYVKQINQAATIEWDGGANLSNISTIARAGVDQINVGSAISSADDVRGAYEALVNAVNQIDSY